MGAVLVHALYLINLGEPDDDFYEKSVDALSKTAQSRAAIDADGVVFHVGSHLGAGFDATLERVAPALEHGARRCGGRTWLLIENTAGAGGTIGRSVDELARIVERLGRHPRLGLCLDSCHLYASGYDVTDPDALDRLLDEVDATIGLDRLRALHINDSKAALGSNRDRHDNVLDGLMGERLGVFLAHPASRSCRPCSRRPGRRARGPGAAQLQRTRELRGRWLAEA